MDFGPFQHIAVSGIGFILHVQFVGAKSFGAETVSALREDFLQLSQGLIINSKVLIDFEAVEAFCPDAIDCLVEFNKRLRYKGSRVVLCCLGAEVLQGFFPSRQPGSG